MRISEIFRSIQGESSYAGLPCTFVRTAGCSLRCTYCDTGYAIPKDSGEEIPLGQVIEKVHKLGTDLVEITGGEPLEQAETPELCQRLLDTGSTVLIETGGHMNIDCLPEGVIRILDVKTPGSKMTRKNDWDNLKRLKTNDEIKFVISSREDFDWSVAVCREHQLWQLHTVIFSPSFYELQPIDLARWILDEKIPVRMQLQMHKFIWSPEARGV